MRIHTLCPSIRSATLGLLTAAVAACTAPHFGCALLEMDRSDTSGSTEGTIPRRALVVREGTGELTYVAAADGTIYVKDATSDAMIISHAVRKGQRVIVSPRENRVRLDDAAISKIDLTSDHEHEIYLMRTADALDRTETGGADANDRGVPTAARLIGEGRNEEISFEATRAGRVYVFDTSDRRVIAEVPVKNGQRFVLSPGRDRATVDGGRVAEGRFDPRTNYRVYFERD